MNEQTTTTDEQATTYREARPAPYSTTEGKDYRGKADRTITSRWHTGETCEDSRGTGEWQITVHTSHASDWKQYRTTINVVETYPWGTRQAFSFQADAAPACERIGEEPAARYSAKTLREVHAACVARVVAGELRGRAGVIMRRIPPAQVDALEVTA